MFRTVGAKPARKSIKITKYFLTLMNMFVDYCDEQR